MRAAIRFSAYLQVAPLTLVFVSFLLFPLLTIVVVSFWDYTAYTMVPTFVLANYRDVLSSSVTYMTYVNTFKYAGLTWFFTLTIGFTVAYFLAFHVRTFIWQLVLFLICTVPFLTSNIIRMISWVPFLGRHGIFNAILQAMGLIHAPLEFLLFSDFAVVLAFVHLYTLFMVIPIFNSMMRIDRSLLTAAADCGASDGQVLRDVIIPLSKPGMAIGSIFVVTLVMGDFITVRLMSGGQSASVGLMLMNQIALLQYPAAAANAVILLIVTLLIVMAMVRIVDIRKELYYIMDKGRRPRSFYVLGAFFAVFVLFLYGPMSAIILLSFQGPSGGLTFPMNGVSTYWFTALFAQQRVGDFWGAFQRSLALATLVTLLTVVLSLLAGLAFRKRFRGATAVFYLAVASLIVPSILISLGIGLMFNILGWETAWYSSALGAHLTWTLPFGLLIMFAVFNRFNPSYEEAARDLGASGWQTIMGVVVPIIVPSLIGIALFGFTLSYDEFGRTLLTAGVYNSLPLEIYGMTTNITSPALYALGTLTTGFSFGVIAIFVAVSLTLRKQGHLPYDRGATASGGPAPPRRRERPGR